MKKLLIVAASICAVPIAGITALILSSMNLFAVAAVVCAAPVACIFAIIVFRKIKYRSWRRLKARVVSVETKERPISADVSETPTHIASVTFSCDGHSYDATMPPKRDNNAPEVGSEIDILFDPATVRAVSAYGLADRMRAFLALAFIADLAAFAIFIGIWSDDFDGFPKIPLFWRPLLGLPMFAGAVMLVRRYTSTRRRADAGKLRPIRAAFAGYRLHRDGDGDKEYALFEYEERGFKKYYESHTSGRRNLKAGDAATLYRDTETGKVTEESSSVMLLIIAAVCFSSGIVVTAVMLLL